MAFRQHTRCREFGSEPFMCGPVLPLLAKGAASGIAYGSFAGIVALLVAVIVLLATTPASAPWFWPVVAGVAIAAFAIGFWEGAADHWLYSRLICIKHDACALGRAAGPSEYGGYFNFDDDEVFDLRLTPHAPGDHLLPATTRNSTFQDQFQGQALLTNPFPSEGVPWANREHLHLEAEGDYWQTVKDIAKVTGPLTGIAAGAAIAAAVACAVAPIFCVLAIILAILAVLLFAAPPLLAPLFSDEGELDETNVGDTPIGTIKAGDPFVAIGDLVYDSGHCDGWNELHPLKFLMRVPEADTPVWNAAATVTTPNPGSWPLDQLQQGLDHPAFAAAVAQKRDDWCRAIRARAGLPASVGFPLEERWTVHPTVDGCTPQGQPDDDDHTPEPPH
jgi:hypothetical protein